MSETASAPYTLRSVEETLGLSRSVISGLIGAGFVSPARGARNEYRFSFQDMVLLRTAHLLKAAHIPARRMLRSLRRLKANLPAELPLSGLRITAVGDDVVVRETDARWAAETGQLLLDFEVAPAGGTVAFLQSSVAPEADEPNTADAWFSRGRRLEADGDKSAAEAAYRHALAIEPAHMEASIDFGALLCETGRCEEAVALYDDAVRVRPEEPLLHFNRAIALEDRQQTAAALASYERCLSLKPELADAHFNAARLHEMLGHRQSALRHYNAYRRLRG